MCGKKCIDGVIRCRPPGYLMAQPALGKIKIVKHGAYSDQQPSTESGPNRELFHGTDTTPPTSTQRIHALSCGVFAPSTSRRLAPARGPANCNSETARASKTTEPISIMTGNGKMPVPRRGTEFPSYGTQVALRCKIPMQSGRSVFCIILGTARPGVA